MKKIILILILQIIYIIGYGQIPKIETPKTATFTDYSKTVTMPTGNKQFTPNYNQNNGLARTQINNQAVMREYKQHQQLKERKNRLINEATNDINNNTIQYNLPSFSSIPQTEYYRTAFNEINEMLQGKRPLNLKRAVFLTENAFVNNQIDYRQFDKLIKQDVQLTKMLIKKKGYNKNENLAKNLALFQYMCDTTEFYDYSTESMAIHTPYTYDFNDFFGKEDWTKMFVSKLVGSKSGQCHSLPLLYLIYTQEIGTEAYLAYSPSHSYIKCKDNYNNWFNIELTNGMIITDAAIMASGYIKTKAIQNEIYMDTISYK